MADAFGVSTSGYYDWLNRPRSARQRRMDELASEVIDVFHESHGNYGSRKVAEALIRRDVRVCRNTVQKLMRENALRSRAQRRRRYVRTTNSDHGDPVASNIIGRDFSATAPNRKWVADITYVPTQEGWVYVAAVMDLFSRRVVGWSVSDSLETSIVLDALNEAIVRRRPGAGLLHHSDRGCQYTSRAFRDLLDLHGIECSMSRRGECWDNAVMERFMNTLKNEWLNHERLATIEDVRSSVFAGIEIYYNRERIHEAIGYVTPVEYEQEHVGKSAA
jgi:transposase InsO family protein